MHVNISLNQMQAFVAVAQTCNFRAAAQALHVSQPALSRTIRLIENQVGARLFDRDTRHVTITAAGAELLPIAQRILENFNSSLSKLSEFLEGRSGRITLASLPSTLLRWLPLAMGSFAREHPQVRFSLLEGPATFVLSAVREGRADIGITARPDPQEPMAFHALLDDPFVLLCRSDDPLAQQPQLPWSVFKQRPYIACHAASSIHAVVAAVFLQRNMHIEPVLQAPSVSAIGACVAAGMGIAALPRLANPMVHDPQLQLTTVPLLRPKMVRTIGLVTRTGRSLSPVVRHFIEHLRQQPSPI